MTVKELLSLRLANQHISGQVCKNAQELVGALGAVQAQDYAMSKWGIALRLPALVTDGQIEAEINAGNIIRTHILRPTWHFVDVRDVRWMMQLTAPNISRLITPMYRKLELDEQLLEKTDRHVVRWLEEGEYLTREELMARLAKEGIVTDPLRAAHIMFHAELNMLVCNGPRRGKKFTYALFDQKVPAGGKFDRVESLARLAKVYFTSHGPATLPDFAWWSGLSAADARAALEAVRSELDSTELAGRIFYFKPVDMLPQMPTGTYILPVYDEYTVGYTDRSEIIEAAFAKNPDIGDGVFRPVVVRGGIIRGAWKRTEHKDRIEVLFTPLKPFSEKQLNAAQTAARSLGEFLHKKVSFPG